MINLSWNIFLKIKTFQSIFFYVWKRLVVQNKIYPTSNGYFVLNINTYRISEPNNGIPFVRYTHPVLVQYTHTECLRSSIPGRAPREVRKGFLQSLPPARSSLGNGISIKPYFLGRPRVPFELLMTSRKTQFKFYDPVVRVFNVQSFMCCSMRY